MNQTQTTDAGTHDPQTGAPDLRPQLFAAQAWVADLTAAVRDDQRSHPTPCSEFDVRALLAHLASVQAKITGFAIDHKDVHSVHDLSPAEQATAAETFAREHIDGRSGAQLAQDVRDESARAQAAWTDEILDTPIRLGWGPTLPGRVVAGIYLMEVLTHGWDLATATGHDAEAPGDLGQAGLAAARACLPDDMPRGAQNGIPFGPKVAPAPDAGPTEAMVNWTGRASR